MSTAEPVRARGRQTRTAILESAAELFAGRGDLAAVSVAEIATAAKAHPNQITYYFGSKDALFVQAAFRLLLRDAVRLEPVGMRQRTPASFRIALARTALALPTVPLAVQAMAISRMRSELHVQAQQSLTVLFRQAEGYLRRILHRRDWITDRPLDIEARTFWIAVFGARLVSESGFGGQSADVDLAGVLTVRQR
ncbi:TetR family transcriptional regulator [Actinoplanes sp. SE50]|uniref:TetR/AcrR family transcriptional regulator C-terminal domain-containing protein n=1 Tax=unclassified Actinoplanes TaxID=2626549 RepID=UPI00023EC68A|nr:MULTISPECIES: TetR/AcrR family transcriptional regulator C-terminal domain-containing protein [unclassified Actinoplanes]AEV85916.1 TetR family transcriptional regulator [Actinoplanes sp. SE50/110]ATO84312.1 TetR family transcriptional regulator [Actinoplanes sp. SE50]SLM01722.1 TetR family transcriptional regulator [Actinoplanes sp. SE50/110]